MLINEVILALAALCTIVAYIVYFTQTVDGTTQPNRWSWFIWSGTTLLEALTFQGVSGEWMKAAVFFVSAGCVVITTMIIWKRSEQEIPKLTEVFCVVATIAAIWVWYHYQEVWWAHVIMILAIPVSFMPTWKDGLDNPGSEHWGAWLLWSVGDALVLYLIYVNLDDIRELPYIAVELACHAYMLRIALMRRGA